MHKIAMRLPEYDHYFSPYYADGFVGWMKDRGFLDFTVVGNKLAGRCLAYLRTHDLRVDYGGNGNDYDLVLTCSDLVIPKNIRDKTVILVQEGMTDPENLLYHIVRTLKLPRYLASTAATGLSRCYDYFCVASDGYRDHFIGKGVDPETVCVTGIPNFDDCAEFLENDFPYHGYVLVATSDARETFKYENRRKFIEQCLAIADGRLLIFKLHPNENVARATAEIAECAPGALVFASGNTDHMIANCDVLVTKYSSVVYVGIALGKQVYSYFDLGSLHRLTPLQNGGTSADAIAEVCRRAIAGKPVPATYRELMAARHPFDERAFSSSGSYSK
jgi:hypothetical protein